MNRLYEIIRRWVAQAYIADNRLQTCNEQEILRPSERASANLSYSVVNRKFPFTPSCLNDSSYCCIPSAFKNLKIWNVNGGWILQNLWNVPLCEKLAFYWQFLFFIWCERWRWSKRRRWRCLILTWSMATICIGCAHTASHICIGAERTRIMEE